MLWWTRLRTVLRTIAYPATWTLPPRVLRSMWAFGQSQRPVDSPVGIVVHPYAPPIGGRSFGRYLHGLRKLARGERVPLMVHISVTNRCDYRCGRCSNLQTEGQEPSVDAVRTLVGQLRDAGTVSIALTGGEPALRDDLCDLIAACGPDISPILFTSGQRIDRARAKAFRSAGLELAFVSLDHYLAEAHDRIRGRTGAFDQAISAIGACLDAGLYTAVQAVVEPPLLQEEEMARFLRFCGELGIHEVMLLEPVPVCSTRHCPALPEGASMDLAQWHLRCSRDAKWPKVSAMSLLESGDYLGCQAGFTFFYVATDGDVYPCDLAALSTGNVYVQGVPDILAKLASWIPAPSRQCLARCMDSPATGTPRPLKWETAKDRLPARNTTERPRAMSWIP